ncbi:MAG: Minf_1886 family protein [Phycisphaerales bacterium JB059]
MSQEIDLKQIMQDAGGYSPESYRFIRDGLAHTVRIVHGDAALNAPPTSDDEEDSRHVSGEQLCDGLRDFGIKQYGLLARTVLSRWGIRSTEDFGKIIFAMVDAGLMRTTEDDRLEDFIDVYDFEDAFREPDPSGPIAAGLPN